jgi:ribosome-associated protein
MASTIAEKAIEDLHKAGMKNLRVEGKRHGDWVLIDAGDVIVHVFRPEVRVFYDLEKMWAGSGARRQKPS